MTEKLFIKNRKGQKICLVVENPEGKRLAIVMHGLGGRKDQSHMRAYAQAFLDKNFTTITFDTTNTLGESDGDYKDASITNYYEDLEDVIKWAKDQRFYEEPFFLAGHSLGGICIMLYLVRHPERVAAIAPTSTVVSGKLTLEKFKSSEWEEWKKQGYRDVQFHSGEIHRLLWSHYEDRLKYDIMPDVDKIKVPVLMMVGDKDESTPVEHQKILFDALNTDKELHVIKGARHTFREETHLKEIKEIFKKWIERVKK